MPMLVLVIRIETDIVFKRNYKVLLGNSIEASQQGLNV